MLKSGILFVVSGPSGTGKTTLCRMVQSRLNIPFSISYTTRPPRANEVSGKDYYFVDEATFNQMIEEDAFLEWAPVHRYRYGTARKTIEEARAKGQDLLLDLDVQGALNVKIKDPQAVLVFIETRNDRMLADRLSKRGTEDPALIELRLNRAESERKMKDRYDYVIFNDDPEEACIQLIEVIQKERTKNRK